MRAILTYHSIDSSGSPISLESATFARHLHWLAGSTVRVVGLEELVTLPDTDDAVAITFDDGFENFATEAWPRLREHELPVTLFVVSDLAGQTNAWEDNPRSKIPVLPLLGWDRLGELAAEGVTIGAHGRTHANLVGLTPDQLRGEIESAVERIESEIGEHARTFAYPFGAFDAAAAEAARRAFAVACTADLRIVSDADDPHELPRLDAYYFRAPGRLEAWGGPSFRRYVGRRRAMRVLRSRLGL